MAAAAKTYKLGEAITGLKYDVKNDLSIVGIDLPVPPIKAGDKGDKVKALQAALVKLHRMAAAQETGTFDAETGKALGAFMHDWGFQATEGYDATVRLAMAHALNGEKPGQNVHTVPPIDPPPAKTGPKDDNTIRGKIVANAQWGIANTASIHYEETRPIPDLNSPKHLPLTTDCSGFATLCYKWAGAPDPNGNGYNGQGYTGTMLAHMKHIPKSQVQKGDLVVFGRSTGHHVCIVLEPGDNPMLASHGGESGPLKISLNDEYAWQSKNGGDGITWLTVLDGSGAAAKPAPSSHPSGGKAPSRPVASPPAKPRPPVAGNPASTYCTITNVVSPEDPGVYKGKFKVYIPNTAGGRAAEYALKEIAKGIHYSWGGGSPSGPTYGEKETAAEGGNDDTKIDGFDCSGLVMYAGCNATGCSEATFGRGTNAQYAASNEVSEAAAKIGDLMFWDPVGGEPSHVTMYIGKFEQTADGWASSPEQTGKIMMAEAPYTGAMLRIREFAPGPKFMRFARPKAYGQDK